MTNKRPIESGGSSGSDSDSAPPVKSIKKTTSSSTFSSPEKKSTKKSKDKEEKEPQRKAMIKEMLDFLAAVKRVDEQVGLDATLSKTVGTQTLAAFKDVPFDHSIDLKAVGAGLHAVFKKATLVKTISLRDYLKLCTDFLERGEGVHFFEDYPSKIDKKDQIEELKRFKKDKKEELQPKYVYQIDKEIAKLEKELAPKKPKKPKKKKSDEEEKPKPPTPKKKTPFECYCIAKAKKYQHLDETRAQIAMQNDFDGLSDDKKEEYENLAKM